MPYDNEKDKLVKELGPVLGTEFFAEVRSYDEGENKVSIYKKVGKDKDKRRQTCRLTYNEAVNLGEFLTDFASENGTGEGG